MPGICAAALSPTGKLKVNGILPAVIGQRPANPVSHGFTVWRMICPYRQYHTPSESNEDECKRSAYLIAVSRDLDVKEDISLDTGYCNNIHACRCIIRLKGRARHQHCRPKRTRQRWAYRVHHVEERRSEPRVFLACIERTRTEHLLSGGRGR